MYWFEGIVLLFCRFFFPKYHKCVTLSRETRLHRYCTSFFFTLIRLTTTLTRVNPFPIPPTTVTYVSNYLPINLHVVFTNLLSSTRIFYRTLLLIFWASIVQSYLSYLAPPLSNSEEIPLGLGIFAGIHFTRILERISCTETRAIPCLYLPIAIFLSDIRLLLGVAFKPNLPIEQERTVVRLAQTHAFASFWITQEYFGTDPLLRVFTIFIALLLYGLNSMLWVQPVRSMERRRASGVLPEIRREKARRC